MLHVWEIIPLFWSASAWEQAKLVTEPEHLGDRNLFTHQEFVKYTKGGTHWIYEYLTETGITGGRQESLEQMHVF